MSLYTVKCRECRRGYGVITAVAITDATGQAIRVIAGDGPADVLTASGDPEPPRSGLSVSVRVTCGECGDVAQHGFLVSLAVPA